MTPIVLTSKVGSDGVLHLTLPLTAADQEVRVTVEPVITPAIPRSGGSVADAVGTAPVLRRGDDILAQVRADRDEWGDR